MSIVLNSAGGGSVTINEPNTASNRTLSLPDNTGTLISTGSTFAGNGPAFRAFRATDQSVTSSTWTKAQLTSEDFDTANCFDSTTNYRFTPNVAGYYFISGHLLIGGSSPLAMYVAIYKNGSIAAQGGAGLNVSALTVLPLIADTFYLNGSTDYIELYGYATATSPTFAGGSAYLTMSGFLARAA